MSGDDNCLHCRIRKTIDDYFRELHGTPQSEEPPIDLNEVTFRLAENLADVAISVEAQDTPEEIEQFRKMMEHNMNLAFDQKREIAESEGWFGKKEEAPKADENVRPAGVTLQ